MKRHVDQELWKERKFMNANGIDQAQPMLLSCECWDYFFYQLKEDSSYRGYNFSGKITPYNKVFFHDLSSQALSFDSELFCIEASTQEHFTCLRNIFGTGWGYGIFQARVTKASGQANLSVNEQTNVIDFLVFQICQYHQVIMKSQSWKIK